MNTKELLQAAIEALKEGDNATAADQVEAAHKADADNNFEDMANALYNELLTSEEEIATKFKNLFSKYIEKQEEAQPTEEKVVINNNEASNNAGKIIKWIIILIIILVVIYFLGNLFSADMPTL